MCKWCTLEGYSPSLRGFLNSLGYRHWISIEGPKWPDLLEPAVAADPVDQPAPVDAVEPYAVNPVDANVPSVAVVGPVAPVTWSPKSWSHLPG